MKRGIAILAALLLVALSSPRPVAANHGSLVVASSISWTDDFGYFHIAGEIVNNGPQRLKFIEVDATYYNAAGQVIGTGLTFADLFNLAAHAVSPFEIVETSAPAGLDHYSLVVSADATEERPVAPLSVMPGVPYTDINGATHFPGEVVNRSTYSLEFVAVYLTLVAPGGNVINTDLTFTNPSDIGPNGSASFEVVLQDHDTGYASYLLQADANTSSGGYATSWDNYFSDLGATGFRDDILWVAESGITVGCGGSNYCPSASVTREQMAAFLDRALDLPATSTDYFSDDESSFAEASINRVAAAAITTGCTPTTYCPNQFVTRGQMAAFLHRALG